MQKQMPRYSFHAGRLKDDDGGGDYGEYGETWLNEARINKLPVEFVLCDACRIENV